MQEPHHSSPSTPLANNGDGDDGRATAHILFDLAAIQRMTVPKSAAALELEVAEPPSRPPEDPDEQRGGQLAALARAALHSASSPPAAPADSDFPLTCLVADDHPIVREAMSNVLQRHGLQVVARASDGEEAIAEMLAKRPAVALVDVRIPSVDGFEIARQASRLARETAVILYTGGDPAILSGALESGARGFLLKEAPVADIARAVRMVAEGQVYFDPALASYLISSPAVGMLTRRELEILRLLADGCTNDAVAKRLYISSDTVQTHVRALMKKLNVHTRTAAVATALRERLIA